MQTWTDLTTTAPMPGEELSTPPSADSDSSACGACGPADDTPTDDASTCAAPVADEVVGARRTRTTERGAHYGMWWEDDHECGCCAWHHCTDMQCDDLPPIDTVVAWARRHVEQCLALLPPVDYEAEQRLNRQMSLAARSYERERRPITRRHLP